MRCDQCKAEIIKATAWNDWLTLMHYFHHELTEGEITNETYQAMTDCLMSFKRFAEDAAESKS